jgi:hypothetical protein
MDALKKERRAFKRMRVDLEAKHRGEWVVFRRDELVSTYPTFEMAATDAMRRFGRGPYLIREVGAGDEVLPASVVYAIVEHA